jgi:hypothetical protein
MLFVGMPPVEAGELFFLVQHTDNHNPHIMRFGIRYFSQGTAT